MNDVHRHIFPGVRITYLYVYVIVYEDCSLRIGKSYVIKEDKDPTNRGGS